MTSDERRIFESYEHAREQQAAGVEPDISCARCEDELDESTAHILGGETLCADCVLDRIFDARFDKSRWAKVSRPEWLEMLEVLGAAANELESSLRRVLRATGKAV